MTILGYLQGMGAFQHTALKLLKEYGLSEITADRWYPLESVLSVFHHLEEAGGIMTLRKIGAAVIDHAAWPAGIHSLEQALNSIDIAYHMNHRRDGKVLFDASTGRIIEGALGHTMVVSPKEHEYHMRYICGSFYPCEFDFGMASAFVKKFKPPDCRRYANIRHDSGECRRRGGETCTYLIEWQPQNVS